MIKQYRVSKPLIMLSVAAAVSVTSRPPARCQKKVSLAAFAAAAFTSRIGAAVTAPTAACLVIEALDYDDFMPGD